MFNFWEDGEELCCSVSFIPDLKNYYLDKILCVSHSSLNAGAEKAFCEMVKALKKTGNSVFCIFPEEGPLVENCKPYINGYIILPIPWWFGNQIGFIAKLKLLRRMFLSIIQIKKYIKSTNAQKLIVNTIAIPGPAIASRLSSVPVYWFLHELGNDGFILIFGEKFSKKLIGLLADKVVCNSQYTLSHYKTFIPSIKLSYLWQPVGIDIPARKIPDNYVVFGVVGRLCMQKAQREAVEAMSYLRDEKVLLRLIGPGNNQYASDLRKLVSENELGDKITFTGETSQIEDIYGKLDVVVVCSRDEALGRTTIEAMKCGLPVIAPEAFGHKELIEDSVNGYFYQLGKPQDLAAKMKILLDQDIRLKMGMFGEKWASENFNDHRYAKMLIDKLN